MSSTKNILTFKLNNHRLALELTNVQEVLLGQVARKVPLAPPSIEGLFSLRGQIITSIDLAKKIDDIFDSDEDKKSHIILKENDELLALLVNEVEEVVEIESSAIEPIPVNLRKNWEKWSRGVVRIDDDIILVLDVNNIVQRENKDEEN
jgi:purine-binding chemotaxis protein CheW